MKQTCVLFSNFVTATTPSLSSVAPVGPQLAARGPSKTTHQSRRRFLDVASRSVEVKPFEAGMAAEKT